MSDATSPEVSVVVCSHNGARHLPQALGSLRAQSLDASRYEVIVVDDGSSDATAAVAGAHDEVRTVVLDRNRGLAAARNAGVSASRAPIVAFTDDDCVCDPTWLQELLRRFEDPTIDAVSGQVRPEGPDSFTVRYLRRRNPLKPLGAVHVDAPGPVRRLSRYALALIVGSPELSRGDELYSVVGANMAFRTRVVRALGGFDEAFRFGGEEEELCRRAHAGARRARIVYEPRAAVAHTFVPRLGDTLRRSRAYGRGNARMTAKHPDARPIVFPIPLVLLVAFVASLLGARRRLAAGVALAPLLAYPRWTVDARRARSLEPVTYAYVQLAQEVMTMRGEIEGRSAGYAPVAASQLDDRSGGDT